MRILILHAGGLGDLVLAAGFVERLRLQHEASHITLACRDEYAGTCELYPSPPDRIITTTVNSYGWAAPCDELVESVRPLLAQIEPEGFERFFSAEHRATWLGPIVAARARAAESVISNMPYAQRWFVVSMLRRLGLHAVALHHVDAQPGEHELVRYERLAGATSEGLVPKWRVSKANADEAAGALAAYGWKPGRLLACFPFGDAGTTFKRWPSERFLAVLEAAHARFALPVLAFGAQDERTELDAFVAALSARGVIAATFAGTKDDIALAGALLRASLAYIGNDTGLAHLAAAYGVPGVTIFGGGTWPAYAPWNAASVGLVAPLPCFGCYWDCAFGRGLCVEQVDVESASAALGEVIALADDVPRTISLDRGTPAERELIGLAARRYAQAQEDRNARLTSVLRLRDVLERGIRLRSARRTAAEVRLIPEAGGG
jgi:ADP-heptose:LPS heptosyltransferase